MDCICAEKKNKARQVLYKTPYDEYKLYHNGLHTRNNLFRQQFMKGLIEKLIFILKKIN